MAITIGVDCGITGAIAAVKDGIELIMLEDMPTTSAGKGNKVSRSVDAVGLAEVLGFLIRNHVREHMEAVIEKTSSMPGQGVASTFSMGHSRGVVEGVFLTKGFPTTLVTPAAWKKSMGMNSDKELVRGEMSRLFPTAGLHRKKDHNRAEAIALALYLHKEKFK